MLSKYITINPEVKPKKAEKKLFKVSIDEQNKNIDKSISSARKAANKYLINSEFITNPRIWCQGENGAKCKFSYLLSMQFCKKV